ncbi:hypothetical protein AMK21_11330 [Streptomyces sp. CB00316]|nr:hypothetical protein AMK21_11330 [Streptomyces sp. CB00316]
MAGIDPVEKRSPPWCLSTQARSVSVISSSTQAKARPAGRSTRARIFQWRPSRSASAGSSGQDTTGRGGSPSQGAMHSLAPASHVVAHTNS